MDVCLLRARSTPAFAELPPTPGALCGNPSPPAPSDPVAVPQCSEMNWKKGSKVKTICEKMGWGMGGFLLVLSVGLCIFMIYDMHPNSPQNADKVAIQCNTTVIPNASAVPEEMCDFSIMSTVRTFSSARFVSFCVRAPAQKWPAPMQGPCRGACRGFWPKAPPTPVLSHHSCAVAVHRYARAHPQVFVQALLRLQAQEEG